MKGILEFNLEEWHEKNAFRRAVNATDAYLALHDIQELLRNELRQHNSRTRDKVLEELRDKIWAIVNDRINMDDLE